MSEEYSNHGERDARRERDAILLPTVEEKLKYIESEQRKRDEDRKDAQIEIGRKQTDIFEKQISLDRQIAGLTKALVIVGTLGVGVTTWQAVESRRNANAALDAVKVATEARDQTVEEMRKQTVSMVESSGAAKAAVEEAVLSRGQAQRALDASIATFHLEQRAWLSVHAGVATEATITDDDFEITVRMKNVGATPALKVLPKVFTRDLQPTKDAIDGESKDMSVAADIGPGGEATKSVRTAFPLPVRLAIKSGYLPLRVFGTVHYEDVFGVHHTTEFCGLYNPATNRTEFCQEFNRMN